jgi:hypothetical protein
VWTIANYEIYKGLVNHEKFEDANDLYNKTVKLLSNGIRKDGSMCESYNPETGEGILHRMFFSWNVLVASMIRDNKKRQGEI